MIWAVKSLSLVDRCVCVCVCVHKDTVVTERDLLVILVIELQSIKADVVRVAPRRQQLQLEDNWQKISQGKTQEISNTHRNDPNTLINERMELL